MKFVSKIFAIAGVVIKELYRRKDFYVLFVLTAVITIAAGMVHFFDDPKIVNYLKAICVLLISISALIIAIVMAARQLPAERESRTIFPLLAKPVTRAQVILGKFFGCWLASGIALLFFYFFFAVVIGTHEQSWPVLNYLQSFWLQWALLGVVTAMVLLGSVIFTAPSSNVTICFIAIVGILLLGQHLNVVALHHSEPLRSVIYTIYFLIPHLEWFDVRDRLTYNWPLAHWMDCILATLYAAAYAGLFLLLTWLGFRRKSL